jgi:hypothetical protein
VILYSPSTSTSPKALIVSLTSGIFDEEANCGLPNAYKIAYIEPY